MRGAGCDSPLKRRNPGVPAGASSTIREIGTLVQMSWYRFSPLKPMTVRFWSLDPL
jgi:hypothetical protein